jgi:ribonuclease P protein component
VNFSRKYRLLDKAEFKYIFDQPKKVDHKFFVLLYRPSEKKYSRLGLIVAKRTTPLAVERNRLKRIFRESFRAHRDQLLEMDVLIIAKQQCYKLTNELLREGIDKQWKRLRNAL